MEKTVNVKIPNEIWVDDFSANKTATFNYSGPAKIWIIVEEDNTVNSYSETEPVLAMNRSAIEVDIYIIIFLIVKFIMTVEKVFELNLSDFTLLRKNYNN